MTAKELISDIIYPVKSSDSLREVLDRMENYKVGQLPLIRYNQLVGLIKEEDILTAIDSQENVAVSDLPQELVFIYEVQHLFDAVRLFYIHQVDVLPVIDEKHYYKGSITLHEVRSEDHTSELQSRENLVCRLLLEKNKIQ